jgi:hypothetical protein
MSWTARLDAIEGVATTPMKSLLGLRHAQPTTAGRHGVLGTEIGCVNGGRGAIPARDTGMPHNLMTSDAVLR